MKNAIPAMLLALFLFGCSAQTQAVFEANPNFSSANMPVALEKESAFCNAVSLGAKRTYTHINSLPARGYRANFAMAANGLGYSDRLGEPQKSNEEYRRARRAFAPGKNDLEQPEAFNACMRYLGWKTGPEITGRDHLQINKNNRAEALVAKIKRDPLGEKTIKLISISMDRLSSRQVQQEKKRLFADPSIFEQVYMRNRDYLSKNGKRAESIILASSIGVDFARCSGMYNVVNKNRKKELNHDIKSDDNLLSMEKESFYYASRLMHAEAAHREKRAYAKKLQKEAGPYFSGILLRYKNESAQCSGMLRGFRKIRPLLK